MGDGYYVPVGQPEQSVFLVGPLKREEANEFAKLLGIGDPEYNFATPTNLMSPAEHKALFSKSQPALEL